MNHLDNKNYEQRSSGRRGRRRMRRARGDAWPVPTALDPPKIRGSVRLPRNTQTRRSRCARCDRKHWTHLVRAHSKACATPGRSVPMGAKCEGVERLRCSVSTRKSFGTGHLTRKPSTRLGNLRQKCRPRR